MRKILAYVVLYIVFTSLVFASGCVEKPIGGERDEHGCLGPAGYSWNETVGACVREWELTNEEKQAAAIAIDDIGEKYATTILSVTENENGGFLIELEIQEDRISIKTKDGEVTGKVVTRHTCTEEEKQADICTMEYNPVCGYKDTGSKTYGNGCQACADGADYWELGECEA